VSTRPYAGKVGSAIASRAGIVRAGRCLEYFTIVWNSLEELIAVPTSLLASSVTLVGFVLHGAIRGFLRVVFAIKT
jgi:hypothetical protein